jgi:hypothetical protein
MICNVSVSRLLLLLLKVGLSPTNAYVADLYEQVSFLGDLGDLHQQIADVPNGGKVRLKISQPPSEP